MSATSSPWLSRTRRCRRATRSKRSRRPGTNCPQSSIRKRRSSRARRWCSPARPATSLTTPTSATRTKPTRPLLQRPHRVRIRIVNPRVVANFMEPRSAVGEYDARSGRLTLHASSQGVHDIRNVIAGEILKIAPEKLRVITQDVGGGFGTKSFVYREYPLVLEAARRLGRSVSWTGRPNRAFPRRRAGTRQHHHRRDGAGRRRQVPGDARRHPRQSGRLSPHVRALYPLARRFDGDRSLSCRNAARAGARRLHPFRPGRRLSRRRPTGGGLCAGASGRRLRPRARPVARRKSEPAISSSPHRCPITRSRIAITMSAISRARCALAWQKPIMPAFPRRAAGGARARGPQGLRHCQLYRVHRLGRGRTGIGRTREERRVHRADRHPVEWARP